MADERQVLRQSLERRLATLLDEERDLRGQLDLLRGRLKEVERRRDITTQLYAMEFGTEPPAGPIGTGDAESLRFAGLTWTDAVERALAETRAPMAVEDIWRALESGGFRTNSSDPLHTLRVVLARSANVTKPARGQYVLAREE